jgi:hypothetical protein
MLCWGLVGERELRARSLVGLVLWPLVTRVDFCERAIDVAQLSECQGTYSRGHMSYRMFVTEIA